MPYPHLGFGEDYIETPSTTKRGFIVPVTKEAIFFDRTHLILSRAAEAGVSATRIGVTGGEALILPGERPLLIKGLTERFERWFPTYMSGAAG